MLNNWVLYRKRAASHSCETARECNIGGITEKVECYGSTNLRWFSVFLLPSFLFVAAKVQQKIDIRKCMPIFF